MRRWLAPAFLIALTGLLAACGDAEPTATPSPTPNPLSGGIVATFQTPEGSFKAYITNESTIKTLYDVQAGESNATIPNGPLLEGPGVADHNEPWSWHLDPQATEMAEVTVEVCDGTAQFVEDEIDYWLNTVGQYCPWGAELVDIADFRED